MICLVVACADYTVVVRRCQVFFVTGHQLNAVWSSLAQSAKIAPIIQYSSDAVKYYLRVAANSGKLSLVLTNLGGCAIIYDNFGQFVQIVLDTLRSCAAI